MSDDAISLAQEQEPLDSCSLAHVFNLVSVVRLLGWEERLAQERAEAGGGLV